MFPEFSAKKFVSPHDIYMLSDVGTMNYIVKRFSLFRLIYMFCLP